MHRETGGFEPAKTIRHNNQVGRDVTEFKATWSTCPSQPLHFTIGAMTRELDIFKADLEPLGQLWEPDANTAIPAVTASHPSEFWPSPAVARSCLWARGASG